MPAFTRPSFYKDLSHIVQGLPLLQHAIFTSHISKTLLLVLLWGEGFNLHFWEGHNSIHHTITPLAHLHLEGLRDTSSCPWVSPPCYFPWTLPMPFHILLSFNFLVNFSPCAPLVPARTLITVNCCPHFPKTQGVIYAMSPALDMSTFQRFGSKEKDKK